MAFKCIVGAMWKSGSFQQLKMWKSGSFPQKKRVFHKLLRKFREVKGMDKQIKGIKIVIKVYTDDVWKNGVGYEYSSMEGAVESNIDKAIQTLNDIKERCKK